MSAAVSPAASILPENLDPSFRGMAAGQNEKIEEKITDFLSDVFDKKLNTTVFLKFKIKGHTYKTLLNTTYEDDIDLGEPSLVVSSLSKDDIPCISLTHFYHRTKPDDNFFESLIQSNSSEKECFQPTLVSRRGDAPETRLTATDVLQVLATKLRLCFPNHAEPILNDLATVDMVRITPYKVLRGEKGIYEKYGYTSATLDAVKRGLTNVLWSAIRNEIDYVLHGTKHTLEERITTITGKVFSNNTPITYIMSQISFEAENESNRAVYNALGDALNDGTLRNTNTPALDSLNVFIMLSENVLLAAAKVLRIDHTTMQVFVLNEWSDEWEMWDELMEFQEFREATETELDKYSPAYGLGMTNYSKRKRTRSTKKKKRARSVRSNNSNSNNGQSRRTRRRMF